MSFEGKVAIVTGSGGGIGEVYAKALADEGAQVVIADINDEQAERVADEINRAGGEAIARKVDVSDPDSCNALAAETAAAFGRLDHLVNNAAIYGGMKIESLLKVDLDYYDRFMAVNVNGALLMTRACYRALQADGGGAIVNQSSSAGWMAGGFYSLSKTALNALTLNLAAELAHRNIRVNAIAPGPTDTEATRSVVPVEFQDSIVSGLMLKRMGQPEDMVGALKFLLSDDASWVTAQILAVDGGHIVRF